MLCMGCTKLKEYPTFFDVPDSLFLSRWQDDEGWSGKLLQPLIVYGLPCEGGDKYEYNINVNVDSTLSGMDLASDIDYQGVPCTDGIGFFPNGNIRGTQLAHDYQRGEAQWESGTSIDFHENGKVRNGTLGDDLALPHHDLQLHAGNEIDFYPSGNIQHIRVTDEGIRFRGLDFELYNLYFCEDGSFDYMEEMYISNAGEIYW